MRRLFTFVLLFAFWLLLSGHYDLLHLLSGLVCSFLVASFSHPLLLDSSDLPSVLKKCLRFCAYLPWLLYQIGVANFDVAYRTLHPRLPIRPEVRKMRSDLKTDFGKVILANSITLTPGTVTLDLEENEYIVHALTEFNEEDFQNMHRRVRRLEEDGG